MLKTLALAATIAVAVFTGAAAQPASWPTRPIRYIVPFAAGGPTDGLSRDMARHLEKMLGKPVLVENVTGVGGSTGVEQIAAAPADGYTIGLASVGAMMINPNMRSDLRYDIFKDFTPIARMSEYVNVLVVRRDASYKTVADLIAAAKKGTVTMASAGVGSSNQLSGELLGSKAGVKFVHVPYQGSAPALVDVVAGRVDFMFDVLLTSQPFLTSGELRAIAVTGKTRMDQLPDVPAIAETVPGYELIGWNILAGPANMPPDIVATFASDVKTVLEMPETIAKLKGWGHSASYLDPAGTSELLKTDFKLWSKIVKDAGIEKK
jgi:tripartite-type tricarboxylate transporter receptor subunit TctC